MAGTTVESLHVQVLKRLSDVERVSIFHCQNRFCRLWRHEGRPSVLLCCWCSSTTYLLNNIPSDRYYYRHKKKKVAILRVQKLGPTMLSLSYICCNLTETSSKPVDTKWADSNMRACRFNVDKFYLKHLKLAHIRIIASRDGLYWCVWLTTPVPLCWMPRMSVCVSQHCVLITSVCVGWLHRQSAL